MVHFILPILFFVLGFLVKYKQWSWLIAGYNTSSKEQKAKYDKEALCCGVGNMMFALGTVSILTAVGELLNIDWVSFFSWAIFVVIVFVFLIYSNTGNRFKK